MISRIPRFTRRQSLQSAMTLGLSAATAAGLAPIAANAQSGGKADVDDEDILRFALNLEYMEAEYYLRGLTGKGVSSADAGPDAGKVVGGHAVQFKNRVIREFLEEVADNELAHVRFYRRTLGRRAVDRPAIDFEAGFSAVAKAAGLGSNFDAFGDEMSFLLGGMLFEDVGVTAYAGAAPLLKSKEFLEVAAGVLAVEAYHMGMVRSQLYEMGEETRKAANAVSAARDKIDGPADVDQGIERNGKANVVPSTADAIAFRRTPQQVLRIVYLADASGVDSGGFYPKGMNGKLRTT